MRNGGCIVRQGRRQVKAMMKECTTVLDCISVRKLDKRLSARRRRVQFPTFTAETFANKDSRYYIIKTDTK